MTQTNHDRRPLRVGFAVAFSGAALLVLGLLGGVGFAKNSISAAQYQYGPKGKTTICHKGKNTITVSNASLKAHLKHGDTLGPCANSKQKGKSKGKDGDDSAGATGATGATGTTAATAEEKSKPKKDDDKDKGKDSGKAETSGAQSSNAQQGAGSEHGKAGEDHGKSGDAPGKPDDKGNGNGKGKGK